MRLLGILVVILALGSHASAADAPACAPLLTAAEVKAAVGVPLEDMGPQDRSEGESLCPFMARGAGGFKTVALTLLQPAAMNGVAPSAVFDERVAAMQEIGYSKPVAIKGGKRAALLTYEEQIVAYVELPGGVGHVVTNGLTRPQVEALVKAIAD